MYVFVHCALLSFWSNVDSVHYEIFDLNFYSRPALSATVNGKDNGQEEGFRIIYTE